MFCLKFSKFQTLFVYVRTVRASITMCNKCGQSAPISPNVLARIQQKKVETAMFAPAIANLTLSAAGGLFYLIGNNNSEETVPPSSRNKTGEPPEAEAPEEISEAEFAQLKSEVEEILSKNKITVTPEILEEVTKKYNVMKKFNTGAHTLEQRVVNYTNGLLYSETEASFALAKANGTTSNEVFEHQGVKANLNADNATYNNAYLKFADEYIELFDNKEGNGAIELDEYIAREASSSGVDIEGLSDKKVKKLLANSYISFDVLDLNGDKKLTREEAAAMLKTVACGERVDGTSANISYNEWNNFNNLMSEYSLAVKNLPEASAREFMAAMRQADLHEESGNFSEANLNRTAALEILKENASLSKNSFDKITKILFEDYNNSARGFGL